MQKIKDYFIQNEKQWKIVLEKFCSKNCELLKHGQWHRVYKDKNYVYKIELKNNIKKKITLTEEFEILKLYSENLIEDKN